MTLEHRFRISSATKLFVAAVVLQLVDEGALALDGEVSLIDGGMTVRQLLNHTSGLPHAVELNELFEPYRTNRAYRSEWTPRDVLALIESRSRLFAPGEGWSYSGSNYVVLGLIVEETTGATLRDELRRGSSSHWGSRIPTCRRRSRRRPVLLVGTSLRTIHCFRTPVQTRST